MRIASKTLLVFLACVLIVPPTLVSAEKSAHEHYHDDFYKNWKTAYGTSCCNAKSAEEEGDCDSLELDQWRVQTEIDPVTGEEIKKINPLTGEPLYEVTLPEWPGKWWPISPKVVRKYNPPDGRTHICYRPWTYGEFPAIVCFIPLQPKM